MVKQQAVLWFWLGVARQDQVASVSGRQMNVDHLHGLEFLQHCARCQARRCAPELVFQRHLQTVRQESDEDMGFDALFPEMVDWPY